MTDHNPNENSADLDLLRDLNRQGKVAGKEWSEALARRLGMTQEEIDRFLHGKKSK